ncbi:MAG: hypothetical protein FWE91_06515 [Defluviitaleaceae bacterium]|nr:hypothetical protein [Defluviitaleaceae bacterium]
MVFGKMKLLIPINLSFFGGGGGGGFRGSRGSGRRQQGNSPMNNQAQNRQFRAVVSELGLTKNQSQQLHREISGRGYGYQEIKDIANGMFGK